MASQFTREQIKICVAKMCITIGWHTSMTTPIEILTDILCNYLFQLGRATNEYANSFGMTEPNLDHLGLTFRDFHINLSELEEYVKYVNSVEPPSLVPKYPIPKEDHLNFLKPGSKEVVTRQVHIHEHLPPMHHVLEANENETESNIKKESEDQATDDNVASLFKKPAELSQGEPFKRPRLLLEEEGRPTREISSVMMTTSGFLSPAREGKLPESRTPAVVLEPVDSPPQVVVNPQSEVAAAKKPLKTIKKIEKKKEKIGRELFKPIMDHPVKKISNVKDIVKSKMKTAQNPNANLAVGADNFMLMNDVKISLVPNKINSTTQVKFNKALAAARLKTERLNTTITPIPTKPSTPPTVPAPPKGEAHVDKLFTEPDKRKINILKKISVKNDKSEKIPKVKDEIKEESRESSPDLIIDESPGELSNKVHHLSSDITIELINSVAAGKSSPEKVEHSYFDDDSPPGTPSTPKTPEMISQSPPLNKAEKRKRKDKTKVKKMLKTTNSTKPEPEVIDIELDRPKTPEAHLIIKQEKQELPTVSPTMPFPFFTPFAGPGLIPAPLGNPLFPHLPISPLGIPSFGQPPYIPPIHPGMPMNFMQPLKQEELVSESPPIEKNPAVMNILTSADIDIPSPKSEKKLKEHKKDKKDKLKKKNKKDKIKNKAEKKKLKEGKKDKEKIKKEKKEKRKDKEMRGDIEISVPKLTLKLGSASPHSDSPDTRKLNIKPIIKKEEDPAPMIVEHVREMSPELAKISALVTGQPKPKNTSTMTLKDETVKEDGAPVHTVPSPRTGPGPGRPRIHPIKPKPTKLNKQQQQSMVKDAEGNKVWICPACGKQDDGSPMIGCDDCDAWYHWVCVGIQVPPDDSEDWYCRLCISKKQEVLQTDKKKKRKKREKKEH